MLGTGGFFKNEGGSFITDEEEERRLFYVGITRAREALILTASKEESPFLENLPKDMIKREKARQGKNEGSYRQLSLFE